MKKAILLIVLISIFPVMIRAGQLVENENGIIKETQLRLRNIRNKVQNVFTETSEYVTERVETRREIFEEELQRRIDSLFTQIQEKIVEIFKRALEGVFEGFTENSKETSFYHRGLKV